MFNFLALLDIRVFGHLYLWLLIGLALFLQQGCFCLAFNLHTVPGFLDDKTSTCLPIFQQHYFEKLFTIKLFYCTYVATVFQNRLTNITKLS